MVNPKKENNAWTWVYEIVNAVPAGRVVTYGQVSDALDGRLSPLAVGWALRACPAEVPWHRVVNVQGRFSTDKNTPGRQARCLKSEGVRLSPGERVDLTEYRWEIPSA